MALRYYANAPATTLASSCSSAATSITVNSVSGLPIQYPYSLIIDRGLATEEVVSVTNASGTTLTVTRGIDSTTAFAHTINSPVVHGISAQDIRESNSHVNATAGVHGVTGSVLGTSDAQTITNKTIGTSNVINGFTASRLMMSDGTGKLVAGGVPPVGALVGDTDSQTLTNKTIGATNVLNGFTASRIIISDVTGRLIASGAVLPVGTVVGTSDSQTLTNKDLSSGSNVWPSSLVTLTGSQTLTNKTLTSPTVTGMTLDGVNVSAAWASYTTTWSTGGTAPSLGNGSILFKYVQIGKTVHFRMTLTAGSTTNYGTGVWRFTPPVTPASDSGLLSFAGIARDSSATSNYPVYGELTNTTTITIRAFPATAGNPFNAFSGTVPFTWATGDTLDINGTYEAA